MPKVRENAVEQVAVEQVALGFSFVSDRSSCRLKFFEPIRDVVKQNKCSLGLFSLLNRVNRKRLLFFVTLLYTFFKKAAIKRSLTG